MGCTRSVRDTLSKIEGVSDVKVDFKNKRASVKIDTAKNSPEEVAKALGEMTNGRYKATLVKS